MKNRRIFSIFAPPPRPSVCDCRYSAAHETLMHHLHAKTQRKSFALLAVILLYWQVKAIQILFIYIIKVTNLLFICLCHFTTRANVCVWRNVTEREPTFHKIMLYLQQRFVSPKLWTGWSDGCYGNASVMSPPVVA